MSGASLAGPASANTPDWSGQGSSFTSKQNSDGTFSNPVTGSDVPDVATIRIPAGTAGVERDTYYMISTTMELTPGAPILRSYDLVNWEIVNYVYDFLELTDTNALRNGKSAYGQGQWASTLRYHDGTFYVVMNSNNNGHAYLFTTTDIESGKWEKFSYGRSFHDPNIFFDDANDGAPYIIYGSSSASAAKMSPDLKTVVSDQAIATTATAINNTSSTNSQVMGSGWEGNQVEYINGYYYILGIVFGQYGRQAIVLRSKHLLGSAASDPYEVKIAVGSNAIAQGGFISTAGVDAAPNYALLFRDDFPTGRIPVLVPVSWGAGADAWPVFGTGTFGSSQVALPGNLSMPVTLPAKESRQAQTSSVVTSDQFDNSAPHRDFSNTGVTPPTVVPPDNSPKEQLSNGNIEGGTTSWLATGATALGLGYSTRHGGAMSLKLSGRTANTDSAYQTVPNKLVAGESYAVSAWVHYRDAGDATATFVVKLKDGSGQSAVMAQGVVAKGSSADTLNFTQVSGTYVVPTSGIDLSTARVSIETVGATVVPDIVFVDDLSVVGKGVQAEQWTPEESAYNGSDLALPWQFGHNSDNRYWSLSDRGGWLRLTNGHKVTGTANAQYQLTYFEEARNILSQRTFAPASSAETRLDFSGLKDGDVAGLAVYNRQMSYIGVAKVAGALTLGIVNRPVGDYADQAAITTVENFLAQVPVPTGATSVYLKTDLNLRTSGADRNTVRFYYSWDGVTWSNLGGVLAKRTSWESKHFKGQRFGLFSYAKTTTGGHADFDYYYLSDRLTAENPAVDTSELSWLVNEALGLTPGNYTAESWAPVQRALAWAQATTAPSTQNQVDAPAQALNKAIAYLDKILVASVSIVPGSVPELSVGESVVLQASVLPAGAVSDVVWSSSNSSVASVSSAGLVTATGSGAATITATSVESGSVSGSVNVSVKAPVVVTPPGTPVTPVVTAGVASVTGSATVGSTLTASPGSWGPAPVAVSFEWLRNGVPIAGAAGATYVVQPADLGGFVSVRVTGAKAGYTSSVVASPAVVIAAGTLKAVTPKITGSVKVGKKLTAKAGKWAPSSVKFSYRWYRSGKAIKGATKATYSLKSADKGKKITVAVKGVATGYKAVTKKSKSTTKVR